MTIATPAGSATRAFNHRGIAEDRGRGRAHVQAPPYSRRLSDPLVDNGSGDVIPIRSSLERALLRTFTHYQDNLRWQQENIAVRTIGPGQAEPALVGQQGVFAKHDARWPAFHLESTGTPRSPTRAASSRRCAR